MQSRASEIEISHAADVLHFYYNRRLERFRIFRAESANRYKIETLAPNGPVAQRLEQRTHKTGGSSEPF